MAGRIRDDDIEAVKARTDIVQLVAQYLTLKKAGADRFERAVSVPPGEDAVVRRLALEAASSTASGAARAATPSRSSASWSTSATSRRSSAWRQRPACTSGTRATRPRRDAPRARARRCTARTSRPPSCSRRMLADGTRGGRRARLRRRARYLAPRPSRRSRSATRPATPTSCCAASARPVTCRPSSCSRPAWRPAATTAPCATGSAAGVTFPIHDLQGRDIGFGARILPERPARGRAGEVPQHRRDADLPQARAALQPAPRARRRLARPARRSWSRATPT